MGSLTTRSIETGCEEDGVFPSPRETKESTSKHKSEDTETASI